MMVTLPSDAHVAVMERGGLYVAGVFTSRGLYATSLPRRSREEALTAVGGQNLPESTSSSNLVLLEAVFDAFEGRPVDLSSIRFDYSGLTERQRAVIEATLRIPRGQTVTYGQLASMAGMPNAARFVGNVMATNRFAPLVPCHRVISANGLGGYGLGIDTKVALLKREGALRD
ncbi:MAG: methylated-DNA--[protein]-cysteine S-methyltransferase [Candidatus Thorarchaeota archaeon]